LRYRISTGYGWVVGRVAHPEKWRLIMAHRTGNMRRGKTYIKFLDGGKTYIKNQIKNHSNGDYVQSWIDLAASYAGLTVNKIEPAYLYFNVYPDFEITDFILELIYSEASFFFSGSDFTLRIDV
jgi:hypothetical protein